MSTLLTPPCSDTDGELGSPIGAADSIFQLQVSHSFDQTTGDADLILVSLDMVLFFASSALLLRVSRNDFNGLSSILAAKDDSRAPRLSDQKLPAVYVPEEEDVLNIVLHAIYGRSLADCSADLALLEAATDSLVNRYAVHMPPLLAPGCSVYVAIVDLAQRHPLDAYILAAVFNLEQLAVACSSLLLSFPLSDVTDHHARRMGPLFLCRLFNLHINRVAALRRLLSVPPVPHAPSSFCPQARLDDLQHAWVMAAAAILCDADAHVPLPKLEAILRPLLARLCCTACYQALSKRIADLVSQWAKVKATI